MKHRLLSVLICFLFVAQMSGCARAGCSHDLTIDDYVPPSCLEKGKTEGAHCSKCGEIIVSQKEIEPLGHSWEQKEIISPSEEKEGMIRYVCSRCFEEKTDIIPKLNHVHRLVLHERIEPTCEMDGNAEYFECYCGSLFLLDGNNYREVNRSDIILEKLGHSIIVDERINASCLRDGLTEGTHCGRCGKIILEQKIIPAHNHSLRHHQEDRLPHFNYFVCEECKGRFESILPIINISCENEIDSDYINCKISTSNCLDDYSFDDEDATIKIRGNWTANLPKKPYRIKFHKKLNLFGLNNSLKAKSWVLLADFADKSMVRNASALYLAKQLLGGKYYSSDCCFVEVNINSIYQGVYLLAEQQQIVRGRIDIFEDKQSTQNEIGFLIEYDQYYWKEDPSIVFEIDYNSIPYFNGIIADNTHFIKQYVIKNDINCDSQRLFIQNRIQKIWDVAYNTLYMNHENTLSNPYMTIDENGETVFDTSISSSFQALDKIIDINSLAYTYLLNEIIQDMDIGYSSFYLSLDMSENGNKKLTFQAPWDFDWCFANSVKNIHELYIGNFLKDEPNHEKSNPWLLLVSNEKWFWELMKEKWIFSKEKNLEEKIVEMIETFTNNYSSYAEKEFKTWEERAGLTVWCSSENTLSAKTQKEDASNVISYLHKRFSWLDYYFEDLTRVKPSFA